MFKTVKKFHEKFGIEPFNYTNSETYPTNDKLTKEQKAFLKFKYNHIKEEVKELNEAIKAQDYHEVMDAVTDIVWLSYGLVDVLGFNYWQAKYSHTIVKRANMSKELAGTPERSTRGNAMDIIKPEGWTPPNYGPLEHIKGPFSYFYYTYINRNYGVEND